MKTIAVFRSVLAGAAGAVAQSYGSGWFTIKP